jgi:ADP-heptose:LPS heptosyltransferase
MTIVGGPGDKALAAQITEHAAACANRAGGTSLRETFALIERADMVVCSASMASHAGAAFGKKVAVGLGPWYRDAEEHRRLWGYKTGFIQVAPSNDGAGRMLQEMDHMGWLARQAQPA